MPTHFPAPGSSVDYCPIDCRCDNHRPGPSGLQRQTATGTASGAAPEACRLDEAWRLNETSNAALPWAPALDGFQLVAMHAPFVNASFAHDPPAAQACDETAALGALKASMENRFARMYRFVSDAQCQLEARLGEFAGVVQMQRAVEDSLTICLSNPCLRKQAIAQFVTSTKAHCAALHRIARHLPRPNHSRLIPIATGFLGSTMTGLVTLPVGLVLIPLLAPYGLLVVAGTMAATITGGMATWAVARQAMAAHNRCLGEFHATLESTVDDWNTRRFELAGEG